LFRYFSFIGRAFAARAFLSTESNPLIF
jgi:hypothetical protein